MGMSTLRSFWSENQRVDTLIHTRTQASCLLMLIYPTNIYNWAVLSDEQMRKKWQFSLLNDEQMSNKVGVEHQPDKLYTKLT